MFSLASSLLCLGILPFYSVKAEVLPAPVRPIEPQEQAPEFLRYFLERRASNASDVDSNSSASIVSLVMSEKGRYVLLFMFYYNVNHIPLS